MERKTKIISLLKKTTSMKNNLDLAYYVHCMTGEFQVELLIIIAGDRSSTSTAQSWQGSCTEGRYPQAEKHDTKHSKCAVRGWKGSV